MRNYLTSLLELAWTARYVITVVVFLLMVAWIADLVGQRNQARSDARKLGRRNAELRAENKDLRIEIHALRRPAAKSAPTSAHRGAGKAAPVRRREAL